MTVLKSRDTVADVPADAPYRVDSVSTLPLTVMPELGKIRKRLANGTVTSAEARRELSVRIPGLSEDLRAAKSQIDRQREQPR
jgi:hypothetical protein